MAASKLWPKPDEWRRIWIDVVKTAILAVGPLLLALWGWWTNKLSLWVAVASVPVPLPLWMLLLLVIATGFFLFSLCRPYLKPAYVRRYLGDTIDYISWVWSYDDQHEVVNALPLCTACRTELTLTPVPANFTVPGVSFDKTTVYCPTCNKSFEITGTLKLKEDHALPKIRQRIRTGEWSKSQA